MKNWKYDICLIIASLSLVCCGESKQEDNERTEIASNDFIKITKAQFNENDMVLGTLEEKEFPVIVKTTGMIDVPPENRAVVTATMGGYIKTLPLLVGDVVKEGQLLLTIENPEFVTLQQEFREVGGQLGYLKSEYERQKTMMEENITSQKSFLKAESEYRAAQAKYDGLGKQLAMLNISTTNVEAGTITSTARIYAPISGSVTKVEVTKGSYVAPATSILEIIDNNHIHLELSVFEKDIMKIKKGQPIHFTIPEASSETYEAEVHLVGTSIGESRTIKVHGHLKEETNNFLTGMFVEADIVTNQKLSPALPTESFVGVGDKYYVLALAKEVDGNYYFEQKEVKSEEAYSGFTAIEKKAGMQASDQFLTQGAFTLLGE